MKLGELLEGAGVMPPAPDRDTEVTAVAYDSRKVNPGAAFVAVRGEHADGHRFVQDAVQRGAAVVVYDDPHAAGFAASGSAVFVRVADSRLALAVLSANFFGRPSERMHIIGITGTNGKTTTSYLIKSVLEAWGRKTGLIGTIQYLVGDEAFPAAHTTPEALEFQGMLRRMLDAGCSHVVSEVSSHALAQARVDATVFKTAVFTNLTRDHLDYHRTMEDYFGAKEKLFSKLRPAGAAAVINYDDVWGRKLMGDLAGPVLTYGLEAGADLEAVEIVNSFDGLRFTIVSGDNTYEVSSPLVGLPNVYNILAAAGAASAAGIPWDVILTGIAAAPPVKGRFEKIAAGQKFLVVIDYAHTEDALERLIYTARGLTDGSVITLFGCGGDRDRGKRPRMGALATRLSDYVVITTDNPRSEDPAAIIREVEAGAVKRNYLVEPDRREAIRRALLMAAEGDVVLIAGKGHEQYQEAAGTRFPFSDRRAVEEELGLLMARKQKNEQGE